MKRVSLLVMTIQGLTKIFPGGISAIRNIDIELPPGRVLVLLGPNGSGKSTLLNCLSGAIIPDQGCAVARGSRRRDLAADIGGLRAGVACISQTPRIFARLTALENCLIASPRWVRPFHGPRDNQELESVARVVLCRFGLEPHLSTVGAALSTGTARRLELARLEIACNFGASMCLFDEPSAGLDPGGIALLAELLSRLRTRQCHILMVEHNLKVANFADEAYLMVDGQLIDHTTPQLLTQGVAFKDAMLCGIAGR